MSFEPAYQEVIEYLYGLQKHGIKLALSNTQKLMDLLGDPHRKFRAIHVAGTNGKGSTAAFLASMLQAAGYCVGLYSSPHLVSFTERIRINTIPIPEARVVALAQRVRDACSAATAISQEPFQPTFFEVTTALAFAYFADEKVDFGVIETGMGGRFDATNVVTPLVSIITNIDIEHTEYLGNTLEQIASEKAGIIKSSVPVVTGAVQPEAVSVIECTAAAERSPLYCLSRDFMTTNITSGQDQVFDYRGLACSLPGLRISLLGRHQVDNAACALAAVECLRSAGVAISEAALRRGLAEARWDGRMERVAQRPDIYLDGAHNPASAKRLAETIQQMRSAYQRVILVIGILRDKDCQGILSELVPSVDQVVATKPDYSRAMDVSALGAEIRKLHSSVTLTETVAEALAHAAKVASPDDLILVAGSLYVVGDARASLLPAEPGTKLAATMSGLKG